MAKFTPAGWRCSTQGAHKFQDMFERINAIVKKRVRKYSLPSLDAMDLMQEGLLAAAYAVDTYQPTRGNLDGYISTVVTNALAMVAAEALTQSRQPYKQVQEADGSWRRVPVGFVELAHETAADDQLDQAIERIARQRELAQRAHEMDERLNQLKLSEDAAALLGVRLRTPAELWILARNMNNGRMKLEANSVCTYLGWFAPSHPEPDKLRYQRAAREIREQFRCVLGIDAQSYEQLHQRPIPAELYHAAKSRDVQELRA